MHFVDLAKVHVFGFVMAITYHRLFQGQKRLQADVPF